MPTLTIYTDPNQTGTCEVPPFVTGDATSWTLKFHNGTTFYAPASVTMKVGHINGLSSSDPELSTYSGDIPDAFKWNYYDSASVVRWVTLGIDISSSVPELYYTDGGGDHTIGPTVTTAPSTAGTVPALGGSGVYLFWANPTSGFGSLPLEPFKSADRHRSISSGVRVTPLLGGGFSGSLIVIRPRLVATATLTNTAPSTDWVGTMDPINAYVTALLSLKRSASLDIQIFGDGRMLFQGALSIFNRIS
jgi:hypothetical protein